MAPSGTESRRVTSHDVARSAGVSRQTVSRALNDKGEIHGLSFGAMIPTLAATHRVIAVESQGQEA